MHESTVRPRRVSICGCSGAGKSTLGRRLAAELGVPFVELDAIFHLPGWKECPIDIFLDQVLEVTLSDGWVMDGNYSRTRVHSWPAADSVIFLDYSFLIVFWRVLTRTIGRCIKQEVLWNGNRENLRTALLSRDSILLWTLSTWKRRHLEAARAEQGVPELEGKTVLRFKHPRETEAWLMAISKR